MSTDGRIISADSHVVEPWDLWQDRVAPEFRERAPRLVRGEDSDKLVCEDITMPAVGLLAGVFRSDSEVRQGGRWEEDIPSSAYDPDARLAEIDADGIWGEIMYPSLGLFLYGIDDLGLKWALMRAYNDWLAEFCGAHPDRYKGIAMLAHEDPQLAADELERTRALGLVGGMIPTVAGDFAPYHSSSYAPLWRASVEHHMPIHMHSATSRDKYKPLHEEDLGKDAPKGRNPLSSVLKADITARVFLGMIFGGVFDEFPDMVVVSAENEAGWAPHLLDRADYEFTRYQNVPRLGFERNCTDLPSSYWARNVKLTFMRDLVAIRTEDFVGLETLMFQTDFPHGVSTYPHSRKMLDEMFDGVEPAVRDRIVYQNAADLYGF
jgi:predicted TIM-barrel fold metal-dependent hydrolase